MPTPDCTPSVVTCADLHPATAPVAIISIVVTASVLWLVFDAVRAKRGSRWLATMAGGILFGWAVEWMNTHDVPFIGSSHIYCYPTLPINVFGVPFWIPIGWGGIIYAAAWTAQRLRLHPWARPIAAAFLAVSIDFSLDPVARQMGFWRWQAYPVSFCGIPYDNYIGWYLIVVIYAATAAFVLRKTKDSWSAPQASPLYQWGLPLACFLIATVVLVAVKAGLAHVGSYSCDDSGSAAGKIFIGATLVGGLVTLVLARRPVTDADPPINWPVMIVPAIIHLSCYGIFLALGDWSQQPVLLASIPIQLLAGVFVFGTPWRRQLQ